MHRHPAVSVDFILLDDGPVDPARIHERTQASGVRCRRPAPPSSL